MNKFFYLLSIILGFFTFVVSCNQTDSSFLQSYSLIIHSPKSELSTGYSLANITLNQLESNAIINPIEISPDLTSQTQLGWCLSLKSDYDQSNDKNLKCFNFIKSSTQSKKINLNGDLFITIDENKSNILSANFIPKKGDKISIKLQQQFKIPDPQPRLKLNGNSDPSNLTKDSKEFENKEKEKRRESQRKKSQQNNDKDDDSSNQLLDEQTMEDFQEIVKPKGIYSGNKTFIETYWMYIIPPLLAFFIIGNAGIGN